MIHARIGLSLERGSILWGSVLVALVSVGMVVTAAGMVVIIGDGACAPSFSGARCSAVLDGFAPWEQTAQALMSLLWPIPTGLGALLGAAITAGEIERKSAQLSWTLSVSRTRWLLLRAVPVAVVLLLVLSIAAGAAEMATRGRLLTGDPGFHDYQLRSVLVPARGLLGFAVGLATGVVLGRTLPALLVALLFSFAVTLGLLVLGDAWHVASASFVSLEDPMLEAAGHPLVATPSSVTGASGRGLLLIPATDYWIWVLRETALLIVAAAAAGLTAAWLVRHRAP